ENEGWQKVIECQMVQCNRNGCNDGCSAIAPADSECEHGKEIHMHVHLPDMPTKQIEQDRRFSHESYGRQKAGCGRDIGAPPHQIIACCKEGSRKSPAEDGSARSICDDREQRNMQPEKNHQKTRKTSANIIKLNDHGL